MAQNTTNYNYGGLGLSTILTLIFLVLKLTDHIDWPWIWVLAPTWIGVVLFVVGCFGIALIVTISEERQRKR